MINSSQRPHVNSEVLSAVISLFFASASISSFYSFNGPIRLSGFIGSMCLTPTRGHRGTTPSLKKHLSGAFFVGSHGRTAFYLPLVQ